MKYPIDSDTYIRAYEASTGAHADDVTKRIMRLIVDVKNEAFKEGFSAGKEAASHE